MKTKIILALFIASFVLTSCNKYEDGPLISLRKPLTRILGSWEVYYFDMNGNDLTQIYKDSCNCNFGFIDEKSTPIYFINYNCKPNINFGGDFKLIDNDYKISIKLGFSDIQHSPNDTIKYFNIFGHFTNIIWDIKRLKYKDLWITYNENSTDYFIKLKKIEKN